MEKWAAQLQPAVADDCVRCCDALLDVLEARGCNSVFAEAGGWGAAVMAVLDALWTALRLHAGDACVQAVGWQLLCKLCAEADAGSMAAAGYLPLHDALVALRTHTSSAAVSQWACRALTIMCAGQERVAVSAVRAGAIEDVLAALCTHERHAGVAENGCAALNTMVNHDAVSKSHFGTAHAIEAVISALRQHGMTNSTVAYACCDLILMTCHAVGQEERFIQAGAIDAVVAAMRALPLHAAVQYIGCGALGMLISETAPVAAVAIDTVLSAVIRHGLVGDRRNGGMFTSGVCDTLSFLLPTVCDDFTEALRMATLKTLVICLMNQRDVAVREAICNALLALSLSEERSEVGASDASVVKYILANLHTHCDDKDIRMEFWVAMAYLMQEPRNAGVAVAAGAIPVVLTALRTAEVPQAQSAAGEHAAVETVLHRLCSASQEHTQKAVSAGAVEVVVTGLRAGTCDLWMGCESLLALMHDDAAARRAINAGALELELCCSTYPEAVDAACRVQQRLQSIMAAAEQAAAELLAAEEAPRAAATAGARKKKPKKRSTAAPAAPAESVASDAAAAAGAGADEPQLRPAAAATHAGGSVQRLRTPEAVPQDKARASAATEAAPSLTVDAAAGASIPEAATTPDERRAEGGAAMGSGAADVNVEALATQFPLLQLGTPAPAGGTTAAAAPIAPAASLPPLPAWLLAHHAPPPPPQPLTTDARVAALSAQLAQRTAALADSKAENRAQAAALAKLEAALTCVVCLEAQRCVALLPCRHWLLCASPGCADMLGAPPLCPVCRERVADTLQLFVG